VHFRYESARALVEEEDPIERVTLSDEKRVHSLHSTLEIREHQVDEGSRRLLRSVEVLKKDVEFEF